MPTENDDLGRGAPLEVRNLVAGEDRGGRDYARRNPADPDDVAAEVALASEADADEAVAAAVVAQGDWAAQPAPARGAVLQRAAELLEGRSAQVARQLTREEGKLLAEATGEVRRSVAILRYFAAEGWRAVGDVLPGSRARSVVRVRRHPVGVVAVITPWNFPLAIPTWKIAPALVNGNAVVLKPATITAGTARALVDCLCEAGLPPGVVSMVAGSGSRVGGRLVEHGDVAAVTFTGSTAVGEGIRVRVAQRGARVQAEMGGKNPLVVLADADLDTAAEIAVQGAFSLTGQSCTATSRLVVERRVVEPLLERVARAARRFTPGDGLAPGTGMGPVATGQQMTEHQASLEEAVAQGASVYLDGDVLGPQLRAPVVLTGVRPEHHVARNELFGPILGVVEVDDLDEAVAVANDSDYGLAAGICTRSLASAEAFAERVEAGVVKVNSPTTGLELHAPFGGIKRSSTADSREQGGTARDFYTWMKSVYVDY